jgi:hypothetical protein
MAGKNIQENNTPITAKQLSILNCKTENNGVQVPGRGGRAVAALRGAAG